MEILAKNLRLRAAELNLTYAEVARRAALSDRRFGNYVAGTREPDLATLIKIAAVLQTTPNGLLGVTSASTTSRREVLWSRLRGAADLLTDDDLEILIQQTNVVSSVRHSK
jgi:transcriptional regulator with XRE-family HTH domain